MKQQLLLLEDVEDLGKKGEIVSAKPGYVRNYLLPQGFAVVANSNTLRKQERLREEREKQAIVDRKEAEELSQQITAVSPIEIHVKVDPEGHMYGSVSAGDIAQLFQEKGLPVERKYVQLTRPIKGTGVHPLTLKLKEGILVSCQLHIIPEGMTMEELKAKELAMKGIEAVTAPIPTEEAPQATSEEQPS